MQNNGGEIVEKIFICSRLRGNNNKELYDNIVKVKRYCRKIALMRKIPIAPHAYFTGFLDDTVGRERQLGMTMGRYLIDICDKMYVITNGEISNGMDLEIRRATTLGIPIEYYTEEELMNMEEGEDNEQE